ncbi:MAG: energy-coupling factor transporter transmembrane protein EcfT [Methanosarcinaceae archaeon]|nr:energy-coupling factor transporter transmembrane protein EcfT [Methanosarcinaceae archaeon]
MKSFFAYVPKNSIIHNLDPRVKIVTIIISSIIIFKTSTIFELLFIFLIFLLIAFISKLNPIVYIKHLKPMLIFFIFIFLMHALLTPNYNVFFSYRFIHITQKGLEQGAFIVMRFSLLILYSSILVVTTHASLIMLGIERLLRFFPIKWMGITSFDLAVCISLSIRFIPLLFDSVNEIKSAQISRGVNMSNPIKRISTMAIPIISNSIRAANNTAIAMECRCYQGQFRTSFFELTMNKIDWFVLICIFMCLALILFISILF